MTPSGRRHTVQVRHHDDSLEAANALAARLTRVLGVRVSRPEAYHIAVKLALGATDAALRAAAAGGADAAAAVRGLGTAMRATGLEEDTPEEAARILREGGRVGAFVDGGIVADDEGVVIGSSEMFSPYNSASKFEYASRNGLSWPDAAREVLRRWPPTVSP